MSTLTVLVSLILGILVQAALGQLPSVPSTSGLTTEAVSAITPQSAIAGGICIGIGLFLCFLGYRFFRPMLFLAGFALFGLIAYIGAINISPLQPGNTLQMTIYLVVIVVIGLVGGILMAVFWKLGLFALGLIGGFFLAMFVLALIPSGVIPSPIISAIVIVVVALICAILVFKFERPMVIISTAVAGAFIFILGVDFFVQTEFAASLASYLSGTGVYTPDGRTYGMLAGLAVTAVLGMVVQFRFYHNLLREKGSANPSNPADSV